MSAIFVAILPHFFAIKTIEVCNLPVFHVVEGERVLKIKKVNDVDAQTAATYFLIPTWA